jgi:hypothetical protein
MAITFITERQNTPIAVLLYGNAGAGKTSLAATFPDACCILGPQEGDGANGILRPDGTQLPYCHISTVDQIGEAMNHWVSKGAKTIILDTLGSIYPMFLQLACELISAETGKRVSDVTQVGWQAGYARANSEMVTKLGNMVRGLKSRGINVVFTSHTSAGKVLGASGEERAITPDIHKGLFNAIMAMVDAVWYLSVASTAAPTTGPAKAFQISTGGRVLYTNGEGCAAQCKTRATVGRFPAKIALLNQAEATYAHIMSRAVAGTVAPPPDNVAGDADLSGAVDTGVLDAGSIDAGSVDAGSVWCNDRQGLTKTQGV